MDRRDETFARGADRENLAQASPDVSGKAIAAPRLGWHTVNWFARIPRTINRDIGDVQ